MYRFTTFLCILTLFSLSCNNDPCMKGKGDDSIDQRSLPSDLQSISLFDNLNLDIHLDSNNYIVLKGGSNVIDFIETSVSGKELIVRNNNKCGFLRSFDTEISLELHINRFDAIHYNGSRNITMHDTLNTDDFLFESNSGAGSIVLLINASENIQLNAIGGFVDIHLYGKGKNTGIYSSGTGWMYCENYTSEKAYVQNNSTGDCLVNASGELKYNISGSGNIQYLGSPNILIEGNSGNGRLIPIK